MDLVWLDQPACQNRSLVGGKAAHLSQLASHYRIPPGFCLTTTAFKHALGSRLPLEGSGSLLPAPLYDQVALAYQALAERCATANPGVAVRSSAVAEDGQTASFAGQFETFLNLVGVEAVAQAVGRCWASATSGRISAYRQQQGMLVDEVQLAVLVQQLVAADVSAVVFSANPVTGNLAEIVINASWGLGESIVGGTVTPDTYFLHKPDLTVLSRNLADKRRMTVPTTEGVHEVDIPRFLRQQSSLNDGQIVELARLASNLEKQMGWPVDLECAYQGHHLYLLQCRPITTLPRA
jgi:phosphoenolpyruvate synthase/pyruvate phosphate dikinase